MKKIFLPILFLVIISSHFSWGIAESKVRIKEIVKIEKLEEIQLFGYGLIVGLDGTGDKRGVTFTVQSVSNMLQNMGITVNPEDLRLKNVAAVIVTATLPPFAKVGSCIDVTISSIGDATNLQGGTLLLTSLQGINGITYVSAQGPISIGGFNVKTGGTSTQKNHPTVGRIPGGGKVIKAPLLHIPLKELSLILSNPDFTTATRIAEAINNDFQNNIAYALDAGTVKINTPQKYQKENSIMNFISQIENLSVNPGTIAKVVINERTGTVAIGENVTISPVAVAQGNLFVTIKSTPIISQPSPLSQGGETVTTEKKEIQVEEEKSRVTLLKGATVEELVKSLNALQVTPRDIIAIFQALKEAGALQAELIIM